MITPVCVIVGVGVGNGAAFARRFATEGYQVALLARHMTFISHLAAELGEGVRAYSCDITDAVAVKNTVVKINEELGNITVLIYNAGSGAWGNFDEITPEAFEAAWRTNTLGLLTVAKMVVPMMQQQQQGSIIVIGATASRRGGMNAAAFAPAKAAQRALTESMARYLWPQGIHVALIIIDGIVDLPQTRHVMSDKPDSFFVNPQDVAATAYWLTQQPQSAWSFEVEARPFAEVW